MRQSPVQKKNYELNILLQYFANLHVTQTTTHNTDYYTQEKPHTPGHLVLCEWLEKHFEIHFPSRPVHLSFSVPLFTIPVSGDIESCPIIIHQTPHYSQFTWSKIHILISTSQIGHAPIL